MSGRLPWKDRVLHFVGVGGAGMSGYARAAHALGATVSGSDRADSPYLRALREEGVLDAAIGHDAANLPRGESVEVFYSSAVPPENPERAAARERGLAERSRAELLGELTAMRRTIAVAGAHGKTTTSAMIVALLRAAGMDPGWLVGSAVDGELANSHWSDGEWLVVEADESDRSMLSLHVEVAVLTNVELDHHATFGSLQELRSDYAHFLARASRAVVVWDRPELRTLAYEPQVFPVAVVPGEGPPVLPAAVVPGEGPPVLPAAVVPGEGPPTRGEARPPREVVLFDVPSPTLCEGGVAFSWRGVDVRLGVPGAHNALNAAAALEAARLAGAEQGAAGALGAFGGAGRRFQRLGHTPSGALVIDDYAHHPTEVAATLAAARTLPHERLVAVFQPHLYSRTAMLAREFGAALAQADVAIVLDVYPARERPEDHPGVSGLVVARAAAECADGRGVYWLAAQEQAERVLGGLLAAGDICVAMGAGDIDRLAHRLVEP